MYVLDNLRYVGEDASLVPRNAEVARNCPNGPKFSLTQMLEGISVFRKDGHQKPPSFTVFRVKECSFVIGLGCPLAIFHRILSLEDDNKLSPSGCVPIGVNSTDLALLPLAGAGDEHS